MKYAIQEKNGAEDNLHARRTQETRTLLVDAAIECLAEEGFSRTTTAKIASRAGVTTGALHHNFDTKEDLYFAVLEKMSALNTSNVAPLAPLITEGPAGLLRLAQALWATYGSHKYWAVWEINIGVRSDPVLRDRVSRSRQRFTSAFRSRLMEQGPALRPEQERAVAEAVAVMLASIRGFFLDSLMEQSEDLIRGRLEILARCIHAEIVRIIDAGPDPAD